MKTAADDDAADPLRFSPDVLPTARVGVPYDATIIVTNEQTPVGEISISKGELPAGLDLLYAAIEDSAHLVGTPQEKGTYALAVRANYSTLLSLNTSPVSRPAISDNPVRFPGPARRAFGDRLGLVGGRGPW